MIQKIREAISLFRQNFTLFNAIVLTVWLPASILLVYLRIYVFPQTMSGDEWRILAQEIRVSTAIEMAFSPIYIGAVLYAASRLRQGSQVSYGEAMTHAARRSFKLFCTRFGTGLITLGGLIAFVIPGIILALRFALIDPIVVLDREEGASARRLSAEMTQGKRWQILGTVVLSYLAVFLAIVLISTVLHTAIALLGQDHNLIIEVIDECISSVLLIVPVLAVFLYYWDAKNTQAEDRE